MTSDKKEHFLITGAKRHVPTYPGLIARAADQKMLFLGIYFAGLEDQRQGVLVALNASHGREPLKSEVLQVARPRESPTEGEYGPLS